MAACLRTIEANLRALCIVPLRLALFRKALQGSVSDREGIPGLCAVFFFNSASTYSDPPDRYSVLFFRGDDYDKYMPIYVYARIDQYQYFSETNKLMQIFFQK